MPTGGRYSTERMVPEHVKAEIKELAERQDLTRSHCRGKFLLYARFTRPSLPITRHNRFELKSAPKNERDGLSWQNTHFMPRLRVCIDGLVGLMFINVYTFIRLFPASRGPLCPGSLERSQF